MSDDPDEGPPDPGLNPMASPGFGEDVDELADVDVGRDVTLGEATPEEMMAADTEPVADASVADLTETLADGDVPERRRAALALAERTIDEEAVDALATAATEDDDPDVRQFAVEALGKCDRDGAGEAARAVTDDPNPWVRSEAYVALDRIDRETYAPVIESAVDDDHHAVRRNALVSLFKTRGEDAEEYLLEAVDDDSERVREWVAHLLGGVDSDRADDALETLAGEDEAELVRETAAKALDRDPARFRRQFRGQAAESSLPSDDPLNRDGPPSL